MRKPKPEAGRPKASKKRTIRLVVVVRERDRDLLRRAARRAQLTFSTWAQRVLLREAKAP